MRTPPSSKLLLFYSYSHKDNKYREAMEDSLALLKKNNFLLTWSDHAILPGQSIPAEIRAAMDNADVMVFLFSQHFISSNECMKEWERAEHLASSANKHLHRIPIILSPCAWIDVLGDDSIKALPQDGKPISSFRDRAAAWQQVYKGILSVIEHINNSFLPRTPFRDSVNRTEFIFKRTATLSDTFISPNLRHHQLGSTAATEFRDSPVELGQLLQKPHSLVHGDDVSGKTSLARYLYLTLSHSPSKQQRPLLIDLKNISGLSNEQIVESCYCEQYLGEYGVWKADGSNVAILDNLSPDRKHMRFLEFAKKRFATLIVIVSSDLYHSYFFDDSRFADFFTVQIQPLTHHQQERLIRKTLELSQGTSPITDGLVDQIEKKVNSVIISNRIVPRYPFYVLSILQSEEHFMPDMPLTSFGHCYYILIVAHLLKSGVSRKDEDLNACFNFLERLAFHVYSQSCAETDDEVSVDQFVRAYREQYFIAESLVNRLRHAEFGILDVQGEFRQSYMYYYFLAKYLASNMDANQKLIERLCKDNHMGDNHLIVLFLIHHTSDDSIIDEVLVDCINVLKDVNEATLTEEDTSKFEEASAAIPKSIMSEDSVEVERQRTRELRDFSETVDGNNDGSVGTEYSGQVRDLYKMLRSIDVLGQALRNKYGVLKKEKIEDVIETVIDGGLRSIMAMLMNKERIDETAIYLSEKHPELNENEMRQLLSTFLLLWTFVHLALVASCVSVPAILEAVKLVAKRKGTPAYELVGYFSELEAAEKLTMGHVNELKKLMKNNKDTFFRRALSLVTQGYMNTHSSKVSVEQAMCSALGIPYVHKQRNSE